MARVEKTYGCSGPPAATRGTASWSSRLFFGYAHEVLERGNERQLEQDDLWELEPELTTSEAFETLKRALERCNKSLVRAIVVTYGPKMLVCGVGSLVIVGCNVFAPVVLHALIDAFSAAEIDVQSLSGWVGALFTTRLVSAFVEPHVNFHLEFVLLQLTAALKALLVEKTMKRSLQSKTRQDVADVSNLVTSDVASLMWAGYQINTLWVMPVQVGVVIYMLYSVLDMAALVGLGVILVMMLFNSIVAKHFHQAFKDLMEYKDERMQVVKEAFGAIQIVKLNAWEKRFQASIQSWRKKEVGALKRYVSMNAVSILLLWGTPILVATLSFAAYALVLGETLTASTVFTSMVLFNAIRVPLSQFPRALQTLLQAAIALERINAYLNADEVKPNIVSRNEDFCQAPTQILMVNATFDWRGPCLCNQSSHSPSRESTPLLATPESSTFVIRDATLRIRDGDFVVIHGPVGSGKTSLCLALLGELPAQQGKVFVRSRNIAYYSQQPWIQNMTIRDNILFGLPYDKTKYERVLDACGLVKDVAMFPAGDATEIGQKGVNLSGGQKARVSLARACYADADVYILDTPLAAVDAVVQSEIFNKCLCGLLESKTVVLVTHLHDIIESEAVNVKVLVEDGGVKVTYGDRKQSRRVYASLCADEATKVETIIDETNIETTDSKFVDKETRADGGVTRDVYARYFRALGGPIFFVIYITILAIWQAFQVGSDIWLSRWTSAHTSIGSTEEDLLIYALLGLGTVFFVFIRAGCMAFATVRAAETLFNSMTESLLHVPLRFFDANPIGRIINRYAEDMSTIDFRISPVLSDVFVTIAINLSLFATTAYIIKWGGLLIVVLGWIYYRIAQFFLTTSLDISRLMRISSSPVLSHISQCEDGVVTLRAYGLEYIKRAIKDSCLHNDATNRVWYAQTIVNQWLGVRVQLIGFGVVVVSVSTLLILHQYLSPGLVGLGFMYAMNIDSELAYWVKSWSMLEVTMVSPERVMEYTGIPAEESAVHTAGISISYQHDNWPQSGSITFEDVKFAYKPGGDLVLKGLSFCIQHNEKIGIVGRTGAGKSSLTMALFRINELVSGRILLDGVDISTINLQTLRSRMSIIPQVPVLFKGSMRAYMDPFEEYSDAEIWCAFEKMGLKEMIGGLDGKLAHELSENGENFSVGERQMLCLARALLRRSRVVVMDEATASIDRATEAKLQEMIMREFVAATVLTIAHRLSTVLESDRIMVLSDGRVVEFDSPTALVRVEGGVFRELAKESGICGRSDEFF